MYTKLTTAERLKDLRICEKHLTLEELAEQTGLSKSALGNYEKDEKSDISPYATTTLAKFYGVSTDYILGLTENKNHPNTDLSELHLSDSAIDILKSGKLNTRLLSELICHSGFVRFLTDLEVCVDRIADSHFKDMNLFLEQARRKIIDQYHPDEDDLPMRTMELAQISEEMFFSNVIHSDLDVMVKDIRALHEKEQVTAEPQTMAENLPDKMAGILQEALDYEGTSEEKRAFLVCQTLEINYNMLTDEEKKSFGRVCKKSPILRDVMSQRGRARATPMRKKRK